MTVKCFLGATGLAVILALTGCSGAEETTTAVNESAPATAPAGAYPLTFCVVSGEKLGSMGKPVVYMHEGREVRFCCSSCEGEFKKDPAKYLAKMDEAIRSGGQPTTQPADHAH